MSETRRRVTRDEFMAKFRQIEAEGERDEALAVCRLVVDHSEGRIPAHVVEFAAREVLRKAGE